MKLYIVRHAESESNASRTLQPHDSLLSELGVKQAKTVAERFRHIPVDMILTSPFPRAVQTAEEIARVTNSSVIHESRLSNKKRPSVMNGMSFDDPQLAEIDNETKNHLDDLSWHYSDEENIHELITRVKTFVQSLDSREEEALVVVTHSFIAKLIVALFLFRDELTAHLFDAFSTRVTTANTGLTICEKDDDRSWRLVTWNDYAHLGE